MTVGMLKASLGDTHIYNNQIDTIDEQINRNTYLLPTIELDDTCINLEDFDINSFKIINYKHAGKLNYPLSN